LVPQVFGPYCFNSFAWVFPTCEASSREVARDVVEKNMLKEKKKREEILGYVF